MAAFENRLEIAMKTNLHLVFAGSCREAFAFYETTFGSKVQFTMTYGNRRRRDRLSLRR